MNSYFADTYIKLMNIIVKSTNEMVPVLSVHTEIDEHIHDTVGKIFEFLSKVIKNLPDFLIKNYNYYRLKIELFDNSLELIKAWTEFKNNAQYFIEVWKNFSNSWDAVYKLFENADISDYASYISAN